MVRYRISQECWYGQHRQKTCRKSFIGCSLVGNIMPISPNNFTIYAYLTRCYLCSCRVCSRNVNKLLTSLKFTALSFLEYIYSTYMLNKIQRKKSISLFQVQFTRLVTALRYTNGFAFESYEDLLVSWHSGIGSKLCSLTLTIRFAAQSFCSENFHRVYCRPHVRVRTNV